MSVQTGKRFFFSKCAAEFIVTKSGDGTLTCAETPLVSGSEARPRSTSIDTSAR